MPTPSFKVKEPPEVLQITSAQPVFTVVRARDSIVSPKTTALQRAISLEPSDSPDCLRQLLYALRDAAGGFARPAPDDPDRSPRPLMNAELTVQALLRFAELRHSSVDDLSKEELRGKCYTGLVKLLQRIKIYEVDVMEALSTRPGHAIKVILAFADLPKLKKRNERLFHLIVEQGTPAILATKYPLSEIVKALAPYGMLQLRFLYLASMAGAVKARLGEFNQKELLKVVRYWKVKARAKVRPFLRLPDIVSNDLRAVLRTVVGLVPLSGPSLTDWAGDLAWASWCGPETYDEVDLVEYTLRTGVLERKDPGEIYNLTALIDEASQRAAMQGIDLVKLVARYLSEAFDEATVQRVSHVLANLDISRFSNTHYRFMEVLAQASGSFVLRSDGSALEELLGAWAGRNHGLEYPRMDTGTRDPAPTLWACAQAVRASLVTCMAERPPGPTARSAAYLFYIGVRHWDMQPVLDYLLDRRIRAVDMGLAFTLLGELWARPGERVPRLARVEMILRLVGVPEEPLRKADVAACELTTRLAVQLPTLQDQIEVAVHKWRTLEEAVRLSSVVAPFVLEAAEAEHVAHIDVEVGDLARSAVLLHDANQGVALDVRQCEWALLPFVFANEEDILTAVGRVTTACETAGMPAPVLHPACISWMDSGGPLMKLPSRVIEAAVDVWQQAGVRDAGLGHLLRTHEWLVMQDKADLLPADAAWALRDVRTLLTTIRGDAVMLDDLQRARQGTLSGLQPAGQDALAEAVAVMWSRAMPGLSLDTAYVSFLQWWSVLDRRTLIDDMREEVVDELMLRTRQRLLATFPVGFGAPSPCWRVEGDIKVPWFVTKEAVLEAYAPKPESELAEQEPREAKTSRLQKAQELTELMEVRQGMQRLYVTTRPGGLDHTTLNGKPNHSGKSAARRRKLGEDFFPELKSCRCIYCGSNTEVQMHFFFPVELGGNRLNSNVTSVCKICKDFSARLGSKRWGELLAAEPEEAADAWWQSQKEADARAMDKLRLIAPIPSTAPNQLPEVASSTRAP